MSLNMLHLPVSTRALLASGRRQGLVGDAWSVDLGYLVHALFARLFGDGAPKPFDVQEKPLDGPEKASDRLSVLAYATMDPERLAALARASAPTEAEAIAWEAAGMRRMPAFVSGQRLGFRLRVCPIVRVGKHHPRFALGAEIDPYLALIQRRLAEAARLSRETDENELKKAIVADAPPRETVYRDWAAARLGNAAALETARLVSLRDARLWRKGAPGEGAPRTMHGHERQSRAGRSVIGRRDAVFEGTLRVTDPTSFEALLARGVGRHRAFGFGMLLLLPPQED